MGAARPADVTLKELLPRSRSYQLFVLVIRIFLVAVDNPLHVAAAIEDSFDGDASVVGEVINDEVASADDPEADLFVS
jgi:hypothetical protein